MNEIIGSVADAVLADLCVRMDIKELSGAQCDPEIWDEIREAVGRAAIAAMREPTEAVINALIASLGADNDRSTAEKALDAWLAANAAMLAENAALVSERGAEE